ncbi:MAG: maleylpyruvate isomerase family mycothiol-dependent enzyme [Cellulomonadaceae bacterium]|nr:maleylpyruvate isomerase family mycothiol-dependent enzyme [Cellulomonadaceae bacterium]
MGRFHHRPATLTRTQPRGSADQAPTRCTGGPGSSCPPISDPRVTSAAVHVIGDTYRQQESATYRQKSQLVRPTSIRRGASKGSTAALRLRPSSRAPLPRERTGCAPATVLVVEPWTPERYWQAIAAERARLVTDLESIAVDQWSAATLCERWSVEDVVAHLTAGASTGRWAWLRSIVAARFDADLHNERRLAEHRGADPAVTLAAFRSVVGSRVAPTGDLWAWLGEVVVHGADIREPLGLATQPPTEVVVAVAEGFARKDFAVNSRTATKGLRLVADDSDFRTGGGPAVHGTTLDLVLAMAGRRTAAARLTGDGAPMLAGSARSSSEVTDGPR